VKRAANVGIRRVERPDPSGQRGAIAVEGFELLFAETLAYRKSSGTRRSRRGRNTRYRANETKQGECQA
jgi:hypothetical protein